MLEYLNFFWVKVEVSRGTRKVKWLMSRKVMKDDILHVQSHCMGSLQDTIVAVVMWVRQAMPRLGLQNKESKGKVSMITSGTVRGVGITHMAYILPSFPRGGRLSSQGPFNRLTKTLPYHLPRVTQQPGRWASLSHYTVP